MSRTITITNSSGSIEIRYVSGTILNCVELKAKSASSEDPPQTVSMTIEQAATLAKMLLLETEPQALKK